MRRPILVGNPMVKQVSAAEKRRRAIHTKRREAISTYLSGEDLTPNQIEMMLQLVDLYGLFHSIYPKHGATARDLYGLFHSIYPKHGATARDIHRQAEAAALRQQKKTWRALRGFAPQERNARSEAAAEMARKKVLAELYQRVRGSAVIPRFADPKARKDQSMGRRPELEVTRFLQVGARYLKENCDHTPDHSEECLAGILLRGFGNLQPSKSQLKKRKDQVHTRLMDAPALDDFDYCIAVGQEPGAEWLPIFCNIQWTQQ
jgi:hypothetical protein